MYLAFWDVVFVWVDNDLCEDGVCSVYIYRWLKNEPQFLLKPPFKPAFTVAPRYL